MFSAATGSTLVSSSHFVEARWETALSHFRRALMECGSPLNIEHSQRIGLLFSKQVGNAEELKRWASIFDAEDVPTTALLLKALVNHDQWKTAVQLLEMNRDAAPTKELSEVLAQNLAKRGLWRQTLNLAASLSKNEALPTTNATEMVVNETSLLDSRQGSDSYQMATNPAFLPSEEQASYCGFVSAVAQAFPHSSQWDEAVNAIHKLKSVTDTQTQAKLFQYEVARLVHDGKKYEEVRKMSQTDPRFRVSASLLRSLVHCGMETGDAFFCFQCLELLCAFDVSAISSKMVQRACTLFMNSSRDYSREDMKRFETVVCTCAGSIVSRDVQKLISVFCADLDLKLPVFLPQHNNNQLLSSALSSRPSRTQSVGQLDRVATTLLSQNRWKEALQVAQQIMAQTSENDNERVIVEMLQAASGSWEQTLQFFSA